MSVDGKVCVLCGRSCGGEARIKNNKGQYAHRACAEARRESGGRSDADDASLMGAILSDVETPAADGASACPGCGHGMPGDAVVCVNCGFDRARGAQLGTVAEDADRGRALGEAGAGPDRGGGLGSIGGQLVLPIVVGAVVGLVCAGLWAWIAYNSEVRFAGLAWAIGGLVGVGVNLGSRDTGGFFYGALAALITLGSVTVGNYWTVSVLISRYHEMMQPSDVPHELLMEGLVGEVLNDWIESGDEIDWPKPWKSWERAEWPEDYPRAIRGETEARWEAMGTDEQYSRREAIAAVTPAHSRLIETAGFGTVVRSPWNIIWLLLAMGTAYGVAGRG